IRALITIAGNPVLSTPNGARLSAALDSLDFMVSVDIYLNETTRHADVILPSLSPFESGHYDIGLWQLAIRNYANYSAPVFAPPRARPAAPAWAGWRSLPRGGFLGAGGRPPDPGARAAWARLRGGGAPGGARAARAPARGPAGLWAAWAPRRGPERLLDIMLR